MVIKKKSTKSSTAIQAPPIVNTTQVKTFEEEYYLDMFSFTTVPISSAYIEKFAKEWVDITASDENILTLEQFFGMKRISRATLQKWLIRSEALREAKELVLMILAIRREVGAITKKYDAAFIKWSHAAYDPAYKKIDEWRAKLGDTNNVINGTRVVVVEKFENVPDVKPAKSSLDE